MLLEIWRASGNQRMGGAWNDNECGSLDHLNVMISYIDWDVLIKFIVYDEGWTLDLCDVKMQFSPKELKVEILVHSSEHTLFPLAIGHPSKLLGSRLRPRNDLLPTLYSVVGRSSRLYIIR